MDSLPLKNIDSDPARFLSEKDWGKLVWHIRERKVLPVIGPELVTIIDPNSGTEIPLHRYISPLLAQRLELTNPGAYSSINSVACDYLLKPDSLRLEILIELSNLLKELKPRPSETLLALARINDFDLFVCSTVDSMLAEALALARPEFDIRNDVLAFSPKAAIDIPKTERRTLVYHIFGHHKATCSDFAVWEEDYMEVICRLIELKGNMEMLFEQLGTRYLLLLGSPFSDWIVRFFLRVARGGRLSIRSKEGAREFIADLDTNLERPLVFFFDELIKTTTVVYGSPSLFVRELARRCQHESSPTDDLEFLSLLPEDMPKDSVFISYASEDRTAALNIARKLHAAGLPVWLDKARLEVGQNYETRLEAAVRIHCSFFISLISPTTEADIGRNRYVHKERDWAAIRHMPGYAFYLPVIIHDSLNHGFKPENEPSCFSEIHAHTLPSGHPTAEFIGKVRDLLESNRTGRPRD